MNAAEPLFRIKIVEKEIHRYQEDVEEWKRQHDDLQRDCWAWEELIAKANWIFERFVKLDSDAQHAVLTGRCEYDAAFHKEMMDLLREWLEVSRSFVNEAVRIERDYGSADGADKLRQNIKAAEAMLVPEDEYFVGDKLIQLRDRAFQEHQRGETRTLLENESKP